MAVEVGQEAPDFELKDQHGQPVKLSSFRGQKNVVLFFSAIVIVVNLIVDALYIVLDPRLRASA